MRIDGIAARLRTTDLAASIAFHTERLGMTLAFQVGDFHADIRAGTRLFHLKRVDDTDPSIAFVRQGRHPHPCFTTPAIDAAAGRLRRAGVDLVEDVHDTACGSHERVVRDDQGRVLCFGQPGA